MSGMFSQMRLGIKELLVLLALVTILFVFIPLNPNMPTPGLGPSWMFSMNEVINQHLNISG